MKDYQILITSDPWELSRKVNELLKEGYELRGEMTIEHINKRWGKTVRYYYQTMTKTTP